MQFQVEDAATRAIAQAASAHPDIRLMVLFGSLARGQALSTSDADIGILGGEFWDQLAVGAAVGSVLGRDPHVVDLARASDVLGFEVARDGIPLFQADSIVWPRFRAEAIVRYLDFKPTLEICAAGARARLRRDARANG